MEQRKVIKNVASTALAFGLSFSIVGSGTGTVLIKENDCSMENYRIYEGVCHFQNNSAMQKKNENFYVQQKVRNLDKVSNQLYGNMRDATIEERESIDNYIKSISKNTGVNFFDIC